MDPLSLERLCETKISNPLVACLRQLAELDFRITDLVHTQTIEKFQDGDDNDKDDSTLLLLRMITKTKVPTDYNYDLCNPYCIRMTLLIAGTTATLTRTVV